MGKGKYTMTEEPAKSRKFGCLLGVVIVLLLAGLAAGALHYFGKLQPVIDYARKALSERQKAPVAPAAPGKTLPGEATPTPAVVAKTVPERTPAEARPPELKPGGPAAAYRTRFKAPKAGSEITLTLKDGRKVTGTVDQLDESGVRIISQQATITFNKAQFAPITLARCYQEEYVRYMLNLDRLRAEEEKAMEEEIARLKAEYEKQREKQVAASTKYQGGSSRAKPARTSTDDGDFKKWMDQHGESDLLKARKQRIAEYEAQRIAEGREY
jgi:hypothetical protein